MHGYNTVISRAPLRISFVGGGTDLPDMPDGKTASCAIDKYVYAFVKRRFDDRVIVNWREKEDVGGASEVKHDIIRTILLTEGFHNGIEVATFADVSGVGSGLGSSAATTCAVLQAVKMLKGQVCKEHILAEAAARIELDELKRKGGRQDQYASAMGGFNVISYSFGVVRKVEPIRTDAFFLDNLAEHFVLFSPRNAEGRNADDILSGRGDYSIDKWCEEVSDITNMFVSHCMDRLRGYDFPAIFDSLGSLVRNHHDLKSKQFPSYQVGDVWDRIEKLTVLPYYKLCGAGGTGHLLFGTTPQARGWLVNEVSDIWGPELPWRVARNGAKVIHAE